MQERVIRKVVERYGTVFPFDIGLCGLINGTEWKWYRDSKWIQAGNRCYGIHPSLPSFLRDVLDEVLSIRVGKMWLIVERDWFGAYCKVHLNLWCSGTDPCASCQPLPGSLEVFEKPCQLPKVIDLAEGAFANKNSSALVDYLQETFPEVADYFNS